MADLHCFARLMIAFLFVLLTACGPAAAEPTPRAVLLPLGARPTSRPAVLASTVVASGLALPGRLLFVAGGNLWLWQEENGRQFTTTGDAFQPAWSPEGTRIAYVRRAEGFSDLMLMPASGGEPQQLTRHSSTAPPNSYERMYSSMWAFYPAFSPDGREIAFASQYGPPSGQPAAEYRLSLFMTPIGGGRKQFLYGDEAGHVGRLAYAPDGAAIVFAYAPVREGAPRLYRYTHASGVAAALPDAPEQSYDPAFSPDGRWLAFAARDGGRTDVFAMPTAGGQPSRLTSLGAARAPAFSPDGKLLAFLAIAPGSAGFDLWVAEIQSRPDGALVAAEPRRITTDMAIDADSALAWGP